MADCVVTFSPIRAMETDLAAGIEKGFEYWVSDQLIVGKYLVGKLFIQEADDMTVEPPRLKGHKYLLVCSCE